MEKLKACLIGAGWVGLGAAADFLRRKPATHAEALSENPRIAFCGIADPAPGAANLASSLFPNVPFYSDAKNLLETHRPDLAVIASDPASHCTLVDLALGAGVKGILVEKPISHDVDEAVRAVEKCEAAGVTLLVNHMRRMDPLILKIKENLSGGYVRDTALGKVLTCTAFYDKGLYHCGTHIVDLLRFFFGEVRWVSGVANPAFTPDVGDYSVDAFLGFDGLNASLQVFNSPSYALTEVLLYGEKGRLTFRRSWGMEVEFTGTSSNTDYSAYRELDYNDSRVIGEPRSWFASGVNHLIDCVEGRSRPLSSAREALETLRVLQAIEQSSKSSGRVVHL